MQGKERQGEGRSGAGAVSRRRSWWLSWLGGDVVAADVVLAVVVVIVVLSLVVGVALAVEVAIVVVLAWVAVVFWCW